MPKPATRTVQSTADVKVTVNGRPWRLVSTLSGLGPHDQVFTFTHMADGTATIKFGDGVHGAAPAAGSDVSVRYRTGEGGFGNQGNVAVVTLETTVPEPTTDQPLWIAIRNRTNSIAFEFSN